MKTRSYQHLKSPKFHINLLFITLTFANLQKSKKSTTVSCEFISKSRMKKRETQRQRKDGKFSIETSSFQRIGMKCSINNILLQVFVTCLNFRFSVICYQRYHKLSEYVSQTTSNCQATKDTTGRTDTKTRTTKTTEKTRNDEYYERNNGNRMAKKNSAQRKQSNHQKESSPSSDIMTPTQSSHVEI
ncbi:Protein CBG26327 [Caenorhabditis briggsae]|uniref:Protein CBG26327 n=1 Tax=Caenorhabditis briggsae TaxID=6238 RepID=B6IG99_CAEBR|nr:Protein CBG26327 [Caenorhabditis briggsae]CAR98929.1 Protein CBG26327 [Caenorhabditis briggsae]